MEGRGTGLAPAVMGLAAALALLLFYIAWTRPDIPERGLGGVLGVLLLANVAFVIAQAMGFRLEPGGPNASSPLILMPYILVLAFIFCRMAAWAATFEPPRARTHPAWKACGNGCRR
ncbi:MAG TPA: hypothetical protein VNQ97_02090 [Burkholderiaceae bacterium]|nr:hypothetical protein [Burkholderiaceae bacterium]